MRGCGSSPGVLRARELHVPSPDNGSMVAVVQREPRTAACPGALRRTVRLRTSGTRARLSAHAAYFAIMANPALDAAQIWHAFQRELDGAKSNPQRNAL